MIVDNGITTTVDRVLSGREVKAERRRSELADQMGAVLGDLFEASNVRELDINEDGSVWLDTLNEGGDGGTRKQVIDLHVTAEQAEGLAVALAVMMHGELNENEDCLVGKLPLNDRFFARVTLHAPPGVDQHTACLRKLEGTAIHPRVWVEKGELDQEHYDAYYDSQVRRDNTVIAGEMFAGKSTFLSGSLLIVQEVDPTRRYGYVDPIGETVCPLANKYPIRPTKRKSERDRIRELMTCNLNSVTNTETKSGAAFDLVDSWNSHRGGHTTLHATKVLGAMYRLESCYRMADLGEPDRQYLASAVGTVLTIDYRHNVGRRVTELAHITGVDAKGEYKIEYVGSRYALVGNIYKRVG